MNEVIQLAKHFWKESEKCFPFQRILRGEKVESSSSWNPFIVEVVFQEHRVRDLDLGKVWLKCFPEEEGKREWEKKGKRHYIKTRWSLLSTELKVLLSINHTRNQFSSYSITDFRKKGIWKEEKCNETRLRYLMLGVCSENQSVLPFHVKS